MKDKTEAELLEIIKRAPVGDRASIAALAELIRRSQELHEQVIRAIDDLSGGE